MSGENWRGKRVSEMTGAEIRAMAEANRDAAPGQVPVRYAEAAFTCQEDVDLGDGEVRPCGALSRFVVSRSDGDTSFGWDGEHESCEEHLGGVVAGMIGGDEKVAAVVAIRLGRRPGQGCSEEGGGGMSDAALDEDAVKACADLVGRTGARTFQIGYDEDPPHRWYAYAQFKGARISVEDQPGPVEAADALSRRLLAGGKCTHCGGLVTLTGAGAVAFPGHFTDGTPVTEETARAMPHCRWTRMADKWVRGCAQHSPAPDQAARRDGR